MKKRLLSLILTFVMVLGMLPVTALAEGEEPSGFISATVNVTISKDGDIVSDKNGDAVAMVPVTLTGKTSYTLDDVFEAIHDDCYQGGSAEGYESATGPYGPCVTKLWGDTSGNFSYQVNSGTVAVKGLDQTVEDGDVVDAYILQSSYPNSEAYAAFDKTSAQVEAGRSVQLTLKQAEYDALYNMVFSACTGAAITLDGEDTGIVTDDDGKATVSFSAPGTYVVSAAKTKRVNNATVAAITAPVCKVTVTEPQEEVSISAHSAIFKAVKMYGLDGETVGSVDYLEGVARDSSNIYHISVPAGNYRLVGIYNNDNEDVIGTLDIAVGEDGDNEFDLFTCYSIKCSNSGWILGTDYTMEVSVTDQQRNPRSFTTGTVAGNTSVICLKGDTVEASITPSKAHSDYLAAESSQTLTSNTTLSVSCTQGVKVTFTVPAGSTLDLGTLKSYYVYTFFDLDEPETNSDGTLTYTALVPKDTSCFYRVQNPDGVTYWNYASWSAVAQATVTAEDLCIGSKEFTKTTVNKTFSDNTYDRADIYLNINGAGYMNMAVGETFELNSFRNWFAIESISNAKVALPDMHYQVINPDGTASDVVTIEPDAKNNNVARMTAKKAGTAIVLVTYDAMNYPLGFGKKNNSPRFSAIWPECTGVFVVTVDKDGTGIKTNMVLDRLDGTSGVIDAEHDILFYTGDEGASYTFQPESGCTVTVDRSQVSDKMTFGGFTGEGVSVDEETGAVTVSGLTTGRHIIKVEKGGVASYQVITTRQVSYVLQDADGNPLAEATEIKAGDTIKVQYSGLINPKEKLSGAYNFNASLYYVGEDGTSFQSNPGSVFGVYDFSSNPVRQVISINIPKYWAEETYTLDGVIKMGGFTGVPTHRGITYASGTNPGFNAPNVSMILGELPQLTIDLGETQFVDGILVFTDNGNQPVDRTALTVTMKDGDGNTIVVKEDGTFSCLAGEYFYTVSGVGYRYLSGSFVVSDNAAAIRQPVQLTKTTAGSWDGKTETEPTKDGDGVYQISNGAELAWFSAQNQKAAQDITGKLTADIDLADYAWNNTQSFTSRTTSLDGDGHVISGLNATRGLFGALGGNSVIKNLTIRGTISGGGAITGYACGNGVVIENCVNEATITSTGNNVGGIVGYAYNGCIIRNCVNKADITGNSSVGGIIGGFVGASTVEGCYNTGTVSGTSNVGGIFGDSGYAVVIQNCYNIGEVSGTSNIGGVGGELTGPSYGTGTATLSDCYSAGTVNGETNVGGVLGSFDSSKASVTRGYYLDATAENDPIGEALNETALKSADLNAEAFAPICSGYPALLWQDDVTFHDEGEAQSVVEATCTEKGYKTYLCSKCGESYRADYVQPLNHDFCEHEEIPEACSDCIYTAPGCLTEGSIVHICRREGCEETKTDVIPATGHTPLEGTVQTYPAYRTYTCAVCGEENIVEWNDVRLSHMTLPSADAAIDMTDNGSYPWVWNDEENRLQSNNVGVNSSTSTTVITFTLDHGGTLKFDYAASSEANYDKLTIKLNEETLANGISGTTTGSIDKALQAGTYTLTLSFSKDSSAAGNSDMAWISNVEITAISAQEIADAANRAAADPVIAAIDAIGEVTLDKEQTIKDVRSAYNALTDVQKALVINESVLTAAEAKLANLKKPGPAPGDDGKITVTFRLIGAEKATKEVDLSKSDYMPEYVTWIKTKSYTLDKDSTVGDLFEMALDKADLDYDGIENNYISSITAPAACGGYTLSEFDNGNGSGWMYTVNGSHPDRGLNDWTLFNGDEVVWHYVNDHRYEVEDWYGGSSGNASMWNKWLDAPDVTPTAGSSGAGAGGTGTVTDETGEPQEPPVTDETTTGFSDVKSTAYYVNAVRWAVEKGITAGTSDTTFSPNSGCTRAQMVTFLWKAAGSPEPEGKDNSFGDVSEDAYYYKALLWAVENGITSGTGEGTYSPNSGCTRAQMVTFLWKAVGSPEPEGKDNPFQDVSEGAYYYKALLWAVENGITSGTSADSFSPDAVCTRGQMMTFMYRTMGE